jgi:hypothetical protein
MASVSVGGRSADTGPLGRKERNECYSLYGL